MSDIVYLRDLDGTGSMHVCSKGDPGAIAYAPAALPAVSAPVAVRVKPLEWEPNAIGKPWHSARCPWGDYYAQWDDETQAWFASLEMGDTESPILLQPSDVATIEAAKAAAQADYAARIMAAIDAPDVAELVEALRCMVNAVGDKPTMTVDQADAIARAALARIGGQ